MANIKQLPAHPIGIGLQRRHVHQPVVQTRRNIHTLSQRVAQDLDPVIGNDTTPIGHAYNQRLCAGSNGLCNRHILQAEIGVTSLHTQLTDRTVGSPFADTLGYFGCQRISGITQKQKVRCLDIHKSFPVFQNWCFP